MKERYIEKRRKSKRKKEIKREIEGNNKMFDTT